MVRTAICKVIARNGGDNDMFEAHAPGSFGYSRGFVSLQRERPGGGHCAKAAGTGAALPSDHEGSGAFAPAFPVIGAHGALANRMEFQLLQQGTRMCECIRGGQANA